MSFVTTQPEILTIAAGNLQAIGFAMAAQNAGAAGPTTGVIPAAADEVSGELGNQRNLALHALENDGIDAVHVAGDERHQRVERGRALGV